MGIGKDEEYPDTAPASIINGKLNYEKEGNEIRICAFNYISYVYQL